MDNFPYVKTVEGEPDVVEFRADLGFARDSKAVTDDVYEKYADQLEEGDVLISGWGANFELDREDEAFSEGAFERGLKAFLEGEAALAFHHKKDHIIGKVLDAEQVPGKGVKIVARVDKQHESSPLRHIYDGVRKGSINALSCGGFFRRSTENGRRVISDVDLTEWSVTGVPVGRGCNFSVVGAKALSSDLPPLEQLPEGDVRQSDIESLTWAFDEINAIIKRINEGISKRDS